MVGQELAPANTPAVQILPPCKNSPRAETPDTVKAGAVGPKDLVDVSDRRKTNC